jgi:hypothetical protein
LPQHKWSTCSAWIRSDSASSRQISCTDRRGVWPVAHPLLELDAMLCERRLESHGLVRQARLLPGAGEVVKSLAVDMKMRPVSSGWKSSPANSLWRFPVRRGVVGLRAHYLEDSRAKGVDVAAGRASTIVR